MPNVVKLSRKKDKAVSEAEIKPILSKDYTLKSEPEIIPENIEEITSTGIVTDNVIQETKLDNIIEPLNEKSDKTEIKETIDFNQSDSTVKIPITQFKTIVITIITTLFIIWVGYLIWYWVCMDKYQREILWYNDMEKSIISLKEIISSLTNELTTVKEWRDAKVNRLKSKADYLEEEVKKTRSFGCFAENWDFVKNNKIVNQPPQKFICRNGLWEEIKNSK